MTLINTCYPIETENQIRIFERYLLPTLTVTAVRIGREALTREQAVASLTQEAERNRDDYLLLRHVTDGLIPEDAPRVGPRDPIQTFYQASGTGYCRKQDPTQLPLETLEAMLAEGALEELEPIDLTFSDTYRADQHLEVGPERQEVRTAYQRNMILKAKQVGADYQETVTLEHFQVRKSLQQATTARVFRLKPEVLDLTYKEK